MNEALAFLREGSTQDLAWALFEASPDAIVVADERGIIMAVNAQLEAMFGYRREDLHDQPIETLLPERFRGGHAALRGEYSRTPRPRGMGVGLELWGQRANGEDFPVEISLSPCRTALGMLVVAAVRDVTEQRRIARELERNRRFEALVDDRERIARDLHDTVIQRLFATGLSLQSIVGRADGELANRIDQAVDEIDDAIRDVRTAVFELSAPRAQHLLDQEIEDVCAQAARVLGFAPELDYGPGFASATVPDDIAAAVVAVLRESLSNVARHAKATTVAVRIEVSDALVLSVVDDGVGFASRSSGGSGLRNLEERARTVGGHFTIESRTGRGTELKWTAPLR